MAQSDLSVNTAAIAPTRGWAAIGVITLKVAIAAGMLTWLIASGQLDTTKLLTVYNSTALGAVVACKLLAVTMPIVRWYFMARGLQLRLSLSQAIHIGLIGNFFNTATPGMLGQDTVRLVYGRSLKLASGTRLVSSVLADRITGVAALVGLSAALAVWYLGDKGIVSLSRLAVVAFLAVLLLAAAVAGLARLDLKNLHRLIGDRAGSLLSALGEYRHQPKVLLLAGALSLVGHLAAFASLYFGFTSLGDTPPFLPVLALSPALVLLRGVPITPLGLGVTDWFGEILYSKIDLADGAEVVMLTRVVTLGIYAVCGIPFLFPVRKRGADDAS